MDNLQFNLEEELKLPSLSPALIDVSSDSGDDFIVHPGDLSEIEHRLMIQIPPIEATMNIPQQAPVTNNQQILNFFFNVEHSSNLLLIPTSERQIHRLFPTVMPHVAGFCDWCGKCYDQIALEILGEYLIATAYGAETVRDRGVRSRAFIDGSEAALFSFKSAGLSRPHSWGGALGQQP